MITAIHSLPQTAGNRARIYNLVLAVKQFGHELHFAHVKLEVDDTATMMGCWGENSFSKALKCFPKHVVKVLASGVRPR
jgi:hypothetical protein